MIRGADLADGRPFVHDRSYPNPAPGPGHTGLRGRNAWRQRHDRGHPVVPRSAVPAPDPDAQRSLLRPLPAASRGAPRRCTWPGTGGPRPPAVAVVVAGRVHRAGRCAVDAPMAPQRERARGSGRRRSRIAPAPRPCGRRTAWLTDRLRTADAARIDEVLTHSVNAPAVGDEDQYWCWLVKHDPGRRRHRSGPHRHGPRGHRLRGGAHVG